jgi:hypothetical protein
MDGYDFEDLLTGSLSASVRWQPAIPCPCTDARGQLDRTCPLCFGLGLAHDDISIPFRCGLINQSAKVRASMAQTMGPGIVGDCVLILPSSALCYKSIRPGDRIWDQRVTDQYRIILTPGTQRALPFGYRDLRALVRSSDHTRLVEVQPPTLQADRVAMVSVATTLSFYAPRGYEVVPDLVQTRTFGEGLPRRIGLDLLDASMRSKAAAQTVNR